MGLVARFALASLIVFVLIAVAVSFFSSRELVRRAEQSAQFHAEFVTHDVMRHVFDTSHANPATGEPFAGHVRKRFDSLVRSLVLHDPVVRVKVWSLDGTILYSDEPRLIGVRFPGDPDEEAREGEVLSEVSNLDEDENRFERHLAPRLLSSYVPLYLDGRQSGPPDAVVEIYQDYSAIQSEADSFFKSRLLWFALALVVLYLALLPIVLRASRALRRQNAQLEEQAKRLEVLLSGEQQSVAELTRLNKMQSDFAAVASHELRTPLTAILGYVKTLRRPEFENDTVARAEFLGAIERQADRLSRLITNLLTAAQVEHHEAALQIAPFELSSLLEEVAEGFHESAGRLFVDLPPDLPAVENDRDLLGEVLANLIDNGLKYSTSTTPVVVGASVRGDEVWISVHDSGVGIDPQDQERVFERFYQSDQSATRRFGGVGLGLHLVRELVRTLGGTVSLESQPGVGSTFTVQLPLRHPSLAGQPVQTVAAGH